MRKAYTRGGRKVSFFFAHLTYVTVAAPFLLTQNCKQHITFNVQKFETWTSRFVFSWLILFCGVDFAYAEN